MALADELRDVLDAEVARHQVVGSVAGIIVDDACFTAATGVTNVEAPSPLDAATLFQVASITKTFTAAAVALLVEEGKVGFDDPVSKHLPELGPATGLDLDAMTVTHILTHQAGFDGDHLFVERETEALEALRDARRFFAPGTGFSYNNAAFSIVGAVIEAASGQSYESFVRERLLLPLGLNSACFRADDAITYRVAAPHLVVGADAAVLRRVGWQPGWELGPVDRAAGGLIASVEHLLAWARFQWTGRDAEGKELVSRSVLEHLHTPVVRETRDGEIAFDWEVQHTGGVTTIEHGGLTVGYCSDLVIAPERKVGFVGLTNSTNGASVNQAVRRWALERVAGIRETDHLPDPEIAVDPARRRRSLPLSVRGAHSRGRRGARHAADLRCGARRHRWLETAARSAHDVRVLRRRPRREPRRARPVTHRAASATTRAVGPRGSSGVRAVPRASTDDYAAATFASTMPSTCCVASRSIGLCSPTSVSGRGSVRSSGLVGSRPASRIRITRQPTRANFMLSDTSSAQCMRRSDAHRFAVRPR